MLASLPDKELAIGLVDAYHGLGREADYNEIEEDFEGVHSMTHNLPKTRYEQVDAVVRLYLNEEYYDALKSLPNRVTATALRMFADGESGGYRAGVIRAALKQYNTVGYISLDEPVYTDEELGL